MRVRIAEIPMSANWQENLVESAAGIAAVLKATKRIAVLGMKTEEQSDQPAFLLRSVGFRCAASAPP
jgi:hypothetical protein